MLKTPKQLQFTAVWSEDNTISANCLACDTVLCKWANKKFGNTVSTISVSQAWGYMSEHKSSSTNGFEVNVLICWGSKKKCLPLEDVILFLAVFSFLSLILLIVSHTFLGTYFSLSFIIGTSLLISSLKKIKWQVRHPSADKYSSADNSAMKCNLKGVKYLANNNLC